MRIQLVSQASVIIRTGDAVIWTDPWLTGKAFNDSWALNPPASFDPALYDEITHLWISHEHPDHFHVPTLRSLPEEFKQRVQILFQKNNSDKVFAALERFGFRKFQPLPHRSKVPITSETTAYCAQIGVMDSCLGVIGQQETVLNLNDCEVNSKDCRWLRKDLGLIDVVLNQFSLAGYTGDEDRQTYLIPEARKDLLNVLDNHRDLGAKVTIPFASFIYFCIDDNRYMNKYANTVHDVVRLLEEHGLSTVVLWPGDEYSVGEAYDSTEALARFEQLYAEQDKLQYDPVVPVAMEQVEEAFHKLAGQLAERYPRVVLRRLAPVVIRVPDHDTRVRISLLEDRFDILDAKDAAPPDVSINSEPLEFVFRWPYGLQTLGVSARQIVHRNREVWRRYRHLLSMHNVEIYLRPRYLLRPRNLAWFCRRLPGMLNQIRYKLYRDRARNA